MPPETQLLRAENSRRSYRTQDARAGSPYVIVAVRPIDGSVDGFNVILATANPSLMKRLGAIEGSSFAPVRSHKQKRHPFGCRFLCCKARALVRPQAFAGLI